MKDILDKIAFKKNKNSNSSLNEEALRGLIFRVTKSTVYADKFRFEQLGDAASDSYRMYDRDDKIVIEASSGVTAAAAFNRYLTQYCNSYFGPINQNINLPDEPPKINGIAEDRSVFVFRYFLNYCTFSYSLLFNGWEEYERLTDWMLLSGVNLYLNIIGHEIVCRDMLLELGYTKEEISDYIAGPAYLPWQWMGNMSGFGGNLPDWWYDEQKTLANKINDKMRLFGAEPIVPGFFGMVPTDFGEKYPNSKPADQGMWCASFRQPSLLLPDDEMFEKTAEIFYGKTREHFGNIHYFSGDPFHEGGNTEGFDLAEYGRAIINTMKSHNDDSIWFLQGWSETPRREMLEAVSKEDVVVISLSADKNYDTCDNFRGYPWIYSSTCNFGGTRIIYGNLNGMLTQPYDAVGRDDITTVGIGMTMEGIELDEMLFGAFSYTAVRSEKPNIDDYVRDYVKSRFSYVSDSLYEAYGILAKEIYILTNNDYSGRESVFCAAPKIDVKSASASAMVFDVYYDEGRLVKVLELLKSEASRLNGNECYEFDVTDIERQLNANEGWRLVNKFISAFKKSDSEEFGRYSTEFLRLYDAQIELMKKLKKTNLENFISHAKAYGRSDADKEMFAFNAVNMLMLWSDKDSPNSLNDYAHREWAGLLEFYKKRWTAYIKHMEINIANPDKLSEFDWRGYEYAETMRMI